MQLKTENFDLIYQAAGDNGWMANGKFNNLNGDRVKRIRYYKGAGKKELVLYIGVNVDNGDIVDLRPIRNGMPAEEFTGMAKTPATAIAFLQDY